MNIESKNIEVTAQLLSDRAFRRKVQNKDPDALAQIGFEFPGDAPELKVVSSTRDKTYVTFPFLPDNYRVSSAELGQIQAAGKTAGSVGSFGSASSISTVTSSMGSAATASSVGSIGSAS